MQEILINALISFIVTILLGGALGYYFNKKLEELKIKSTRDLQIETFYRDLSGKKLEENFEKWSDMLFDMEKLNTTPQAELQKDITKMLKNIFLYSSKETIDKAVKMQQYTFSGEYSEEGGKYVYLILVASVICSLKKDFTGYEIKEIDLLKLKINDINQKMEEFEKAYEIAQNI